MLIRFFKSSFYAQYLVLLVIAAGLWLRVYIDPCPQIIPDQESPLFSLLIGFFGASKLVSSIIGFAILLINAILINFILIRHELLPKNSLIGALVFIVLMSQSAAAISLNPILCAGLFIIPAFDQILSTYGKADPTQQVFSASFLLAIASLLYFPSILLLLILILSFIIFGTFSVRLFLVAISGSFAVYLYQLVYYFLTDNLEGQFGLYLEWFNAVPSFVFPHLGFQYLIWGLILLLFIVATLYSISHLNEWNISIRKKVLLNLWFMVLGASSLIFEGDKFMLAILIVMIPFSVTISSYLANRKKASRVLEIYFLILLIAIFANNLLLSACY